MFGLTFGFAAGLLALPLAGLPILLHLLFRRKSPVVQFSTLRFIKSSLQHTAARRRVRRWLLLACRTLLLALLIWAISQPAVRPAGAFAGSGRSTTAVIVVDTSYSMLYQEQQTTLLARADGIVRDLLANPLRGAQVAILRSEPAPANRPEAEELRRQETFRNSEQIRWSTPLPTPNPHPLVDRAAAAVEMLARRDADEKWLVIVSDFQRKEFPRQIPALPGGRIILMDLHPADPRSAGVTRVALDPPQPTPGANSEAVVDLTGRPDDARQVNVSTESLDDKATTRSPPQPANFDSAGHARLRFPLKIPQRGWVRVEASLELAEPLAWGRSRGCLLQAPPRQIVDAIGGADLGSAMRPVILALDPSEGQSPAWALSVRAVGDIAPDANVVALMLSSWPDRARADRLLAFVRAGGRLIWFLRPGLEQAWSRLPDAQKEALAPLLPGTPIVEPRQAPASMVAITTPSDPALSGLTDPRFQLDKVIVYRYVPIEAIERDATTLLSVYPQTPAPGLEGGGLVFRRPVGAGVSFVVATLPDRPYSTMFLNPTFAPMLVQMSLRPPERSDAQNADVGAPLVASGPTFAGLGELRMQGPQGDVIAVAATSAPGLPGGHKFVYDRDDLPGLYRWRRPSDDAILAMGLVQPPGAEADLVYTPAASVAAPGADLVTARSSAELAERFESLRRPRPRWTAAIGLVMLLMCLEALMGSAASVWKSVKPAAFSPSAPDAAVKGAR